MHLQLSIPVLTEFDFDFDLTLTFRACVLKFTCAFIRDGDANPEPSTLAAGFHRSHAVWMEVTAYCACPKCCGPNAKGLTASGEPVTYNLGRFVAADTSVLPFGSRVRIPGYHNGEAVPVLDRGGAIKGYHLDVFFPSHQQALDWGRRWVVVEIE